MVSQTQKTLGGSFYRAHNKSEIIAKLNDVINEKDKINDKMVHTVRDKLEQDRQIIQMTHELGNLKEAYNELKAER